ncbi:hypothetical protein ACFLY7_00085 [Patescibacteria group bacterium]
MTEDALVFYNKETEERKRKARKDFEESFGANYRVPSGFISRFLEGSSGLEGKVIKTLPSEKFFFG